MENDGYKNPLIWKTFKFVTKINILNIDLIFIFKNMVLMLQYAFDLSVINVFWFFW